MKIVSANYRDRGSPYRWLIRDEGEPLDTAKAFKSVKATGVKFERSSEEEAGFGCSIVARCETAVGHEPEPKNSTQLTFEINDFVDSGGNIVKCCEGLTLDSDGTVLATINSEMPPPPDDDAR